MIEEERYFSCGFGIGVYRRRDHYHLFLIYIGIWLSDLFKLFRAGVLFI